jgi:hypothetical protein
MGGKEGAEIIGRRASMAAAKRKEHTTEKQGREVK